MNDPRFAAIQAQLRPSDAAEEALRRRMAALRPRRSRAGYLAAAVCAALVLCACPVYRSLTAPPPQHSYVLLDPGEPYVDTAGDNSCAEENSSAPEDAPVDEPPDSAPNPGPAPNPPYQGAGISAYQCLMSHFGGGSKPDYPDWYGGAYLNEEGRLTVLVVKGFTPDLPESLRNSSAVVIGEAPVKYSLAHLRDLQERAGDAMWELGVFDSCGVSQEANQVNLTIREASREALAVLAEIDPEDDAIYVAVIPWSVDLYGDVPAEDSVSRQHDIEFPEPYFGNPAAPVPDEDDAIAYEPVDPN